MKTAVALCIQESAGSPTGCTSTDNTKGIPGTISATNEVESASVTDGVITVNLKDSAKLGTSATIVFEPKTSPNDTNVRWKVTTTNISSQAVKTAIEKNSSAS
jgi:type IV pilus assembly protein PilA